MRFEFATSGRIIFGPGTLREVPVLAGRMGSRVCLVTSRDLDRAASLIGLLHEKGLSCTTFQVHGEPTTESVSTGVRLAREAGCDLVIGIGGGSVIDAGKAIAALLTNAGDLCEYLEVIGLGKDLNNVSAPFIAIPTTAGTGAEVTRNAVIVSLSHHVKVSMRSPVMLPRLAVVDPELTYSLPRSITASTGLDALTQLMEAFVTHRANPLTDGFCREGLVRATRALRTAYEKGDPQSRADMSLASLLSGLALANAGLGAVHGLAGPLGGMFPAPHGIVCARLLPIVIERNILALSSRCADSPALERYAEIARICTGHAAAQADDGMTWLQELCSFLAVPGLASFGMREQDIPAIVQQTQMASSMKANPIPLTDAELSSILKRAL